MKRVLSRYAALDYESKHREAELRKLRDRVRRLEDVNDHYREMLNGAAFPSRRDN